MDADMVFKNPYRPLFNKMSSYKETIHAWTSQDNPGCFWLSWGFLYISCVFFSIPETQISFGPIRQKYIMLKMESGKWENGYYNSVCDSWCVMLTQIRFYHVRFKKVCPGQSILKELIVRFCWSLWKHECAGCRDVIADLLSRHERD